MNAVYEQEHQLKRQGKSSNEVNLNSGNACQSNHGAICNIFRNYCVEAKPMQVLIKKGYTDWLWKSMSQIDLKLYKTFWIWIEKEVEHYSGPITTKKRQKTQCFTKATKITKPSFATTKKINAWWNITITSPLNHQYHQGNQLPKVTGPNSYN